MSNEGPTVVCSKNSYVIQEGQSLAAAIQSQCKVNRAEAGQLAEKWAKNKKTVYDLEQWATLLQRRSPTLESLPIATVKEKLIARVAKAMGIKPADVPRSIKFVNVHPGEEIDIHVVRYADGGVDLVDAAQAMALARREIDYQWVQGLGCFSGQTYLRLEDDSSITFDQLLNLPEQTALPTLACWHPDQKKVVYQQPKGLLAHHFSDMKEIWQLFLDDNSSVGLNVTSNHVLHTSRNDLGTDLAPDQFAEEERLFDPCNDNFLKIQKEKIKKYQIKDVFNLSFTDHGGQNITPYFLVSPDGDHWVIAHNVKL